MSNLATIIEQAFEDRANLSATNCPDEIRQAVNEALAGLDNGSLRVAEKKDGDWVVNQWLKKAVLLSFKLNDNKPIDLVICVFMIKWIPNSLIGAKHNLKKQAFVSSPLRSLVKVHSSPKTPF